MVKETTTEFIILQLVNIHKMGSYIFDLALSPYMLTLSNTATNFQPSIVTVGAAGSWYAEKVVFNQDTTINKLAFTLGLLGSGTAYTYFVGITTSLGPYGTHPYTIDNIAGSAASLGFSIATITQRNTASDNLFVVSLPNDFTCLKDVSYWLCLQTISRASTTFNFWTRGDAAASARRGQASMWFAAVGTGLSLVPAGSQPSSIVIAGYESSSGSSTWYPQGDYVWDETFSSNQTLRHKFTEPSTYEFGARFEINDFQAQELNLHYVKYSNIFPIDSNIEYTCKLYDHRYQEVGIAITEKANYASATATDRGDMYWYFVPPKKISPDFAYYLGLSCSGGTASSSFHRVITKSGGDMMKNQYDHYCDYIERASSGIAFSQNITYYSGQTQKWYPNIFLGVSVNKKMRRGNGN